jgi:phosphatidylglycerophosphate synthase
MLGMTFSHDVELINSIVLFGLAAVAGILYGFRLMMKGRARFDRVDRAGGSALFNKQTMEGGYWLIQPLARLLVSWHITANMVSAGSFAFGLFAGLSLAYGHFGSAACFSTISAVLDSLDGIVARETGTSSDAGEVLDASVDRYVEFFFCAGLVIYYREIPVYCGLALLTFLGCFMVSYSSAKAEALFVDPPKGSMRRPERALYLTLGAALSPVTIPWLETVREYAVPIAHPMVIAMGLVAVLANVSAVERLWAVAVTVREREDVRKRVAETVLVASEDAASEHSDSDEAHEHV